MYVIFARSRFRCYHNDNKRLDSRIIFFIFSYSTQSSKGSKEIFLIKPHNKKKKKNSTNLSDDLLYKGCLLHKYDVPIH